MGRHVYCKAAPGVLHEHESDEVPVRTHQADNSRIVTLHGEVNEYSISLIVVQLLQLANINSNPIHLVISTYGGSVDEMFGLYDAIKFLPCPVHTVALGKVMSAGVLLLASGAKGKRLIGASSRVMIHPLSGGTGGNVFEIVNSSREHARLHEQMCAALVSETKMTKEQVETFMKAGHDVYMTAKEAIDLGIADIIIGSANSKL